MNLTIYSQGNSPFHPLNRRQGGPHGRSGNFGNKQNFLSHDPLEVETEVYLLYGLKYAVWGKWLSRQLVANSQKGLALQVVVTNIYF